MIMSAYSLKQFIELPNNELKKLKIGYLVRNTLPEILQMELITDFEVERLQNQDYSKMVLDMNFSVLRKVNPKLSILENRTVGEYTRYYAFTVKYKNQEYLVSSEWYESNLVPYINWLKRKVNFS
jgi:hypothetical protein